MPLLIKDGSGGGKSLECENRRGELEEEERENRSTTGMRESRPAMGWVAEEGDSGKERSHKSKQLCDKQGRLCHLERSAEKRKGKNVAPART